MVLLKFVIMILYNKGEDNNGKNKKSKDNKFMCFISCDFRTYGYIRVAFTNAYD